MKFYVIYIIYNYYARYGKYLKHKTKYLGLKNNLSSGAGIVLHKNVCENIIKNKHLINYNIIDLNYNFDKLL